MIPRSGIALVLLVAAAVGATMLALGPLWLAGLAIAALAWFTVPGVLLAHRLYGGGADSRGAAWLVGPAWGFALSSVLLLALWAIGLRHWSAIVIAPAIAMTVLLPARRLKGLLSPPKLTRRDAVAVALVFLLVPAVVGWPFANVGREVADGRAYRAYFTADFVWQMAVVAEVAKGDFPPHNQFLAGAPLHYYWLPHLFSSVEYRHLGGGVRLESLLLMNSVLLGLGFMASLYGLTRQFVDSPVAAALACFGAVCLTSFEGLDRLIVYWRQGTPFSALWNLNIDAVSRWFYGAPPTDGLQRLLLYQPQHHAMAYAVGTSAVTVLAQSRAPQRLGMMVLTGCLLALTLLLSSFVALMLTGAAIAYAFILVITRGGWRDLAPAAAGLGVPLGIALAVAVSLGYIDRSGSVLELVVNKMALVHPVYTVFLNFGPMLIAGAIGLVLAASRRAALALPVALMVGLAFLSYYFVNVRDVQDVYVALLSGRMIYIAFAPAAAYLIQAAWAAGRTARVLAVVGGVALIVTGLPMTVIDVINTQDIGNRRQGPGFPWTVVVSKDEVETLEWIRTNTPPDALVQVEPYVRGRTTWAYIPAFAERRMAAGLPLSMVPLRPYEEASERVRSIYTSTDADKAYTLARDLHIDYLVVASPERQRYPVFAQLLETHPERFERVHGNETIAVYAVAGGQRESGR